MVKIAKSGMMIVFLSLGCSGNNDRPQPQGETDHKDKLLLAKAPAGAKGVIETRKKARDGEEVVVEARIGGTGHKSPFVKGRASFTIIDMSREPCDDDGCGDPWCSLDKKERLASTTFVRFVDDGGKTLAEDIEKTLGLKQCQVVVVTGKAKREADDTLTIEASGIHVKE